MSFCWSYACLLLPKKKHPETQNSQKEKQKKRRSISRNPSTSSQEGDGNRKPQRSPRSIIAKQKKSETKQPRNHFQVPEPDLCAFDPHSQKSKAEKKKSPICPDFQIIKRRRRKKISQKRTEEPRKTQEKRALQVQKKVKVIKGHRNKKRLFFIGISFDAQKEDAQNKWRAWNEYSKISNPVEKVLGCFHAPLCLSAVELWRAAFLCCVVRNSP